MEHFQAIQQQARKKRDAAIKAAQAEYLQTVQDLRRIRHALSEGPVTKPCKRVSPASLPRAKNDSMRGWPAFRAALAVLEQRGPTTLVELTVAIQANGCRTLDDPRRVMHALHASFKYHGDKYRCDDQKRWTVV
jgi:hypothetical protein